MRSCAFGTCRLSGFTIPPNYKNIDISEIIFTGSWCSGITSASHAEGPGFKSQWVHLVLSLLSCVFYTRFPVKNQSAQLSRGCFQQLSGDHPTNFPGKPVYKESCSAPFCGRTRCTTSTPPTCDKEPVDHGPAVALDLLLLSIGPVPSQCWICSIGLISAAERFTK